MGQSTSIGQSVDGTNVINATNGINTQNSNLNSQYDLGNANSLLNSSLGAATTNATNNAVNQAAGQIASTKGINPAMAARLANQNAAMQSQQSVNGLVQNAASQNLQAQGLVSNNLNSMNSTAQSGINAINGANASTDNNTSNIVAGAVGGLAKGAAAAFAHGGMVGYADGGAVAPNSPTTMSRLGQALSGAGSQMSSQSNAPGFGAGEGAGALIGKGIASIFTPSAEQQDMNALDEMGKAGAYAKGGKVAKVPAMVSPGERYLPPKDAKAVLQGKLDALKAGRKVPGKAPVKGDSPKNDIVSATLEQGGVVIPRSVLDSPNPHKAASKFVAAALMHHKLTKKYGK